MKIERKYEIEEDGEILTGEITGFEVTWSDGKKTIETKLSEKKIRW